MIRHLFLIGAAACCLLQTTAAQAQKSLSQAKVDTVQLEDADLESVLEFLSLKARELGASPSNIVLFDPQGELAAANPKITLSLRDVPLSEVIKYVSELSGNTFLIDSEAVLMGRKADLVALQALRRQRTAPSPNDRIVQALQAIQVPSLSFDKTPLSEALEFCRQVAAGAPNASVPLNLVIRPGIVGNPGEKLVSLNLTNTSLLTALQYATEGASCSLRFDPRAVVVGEPASLAPIKPEIRGKNPQFDVILRSQINEITLEEAPMSEVMEVLAYYCKDPGVAPDGPNFILLSQTEKTATLTLSRIRGIDLLRYFNEQTGTNFRVEADAIVIFDRPPPKPKK